MCLGLAIALVVVVGQFWNDKACLSGNTLMDSMEKHLDTKRSPTHT